MARLSRHLAGRGPPVTGGVARVRQAINPTERQAAIDALKPGRHPIQLTVDQVTWTSALDDDETLQGGRTVIGQLPDGTTRVAVRFPPRDNPALDGLIAGAEMALTVEFKGWNPLFARPEFNVHGEHGAVTSR